MFFFFFSLFFLLQVNFVVTHYMPSQHELSINMRAILVDWLVEVQQNFELNHETLYMAVKMVDLYLVRQPAILKDRLQLVGATALSIACKFEVLRASVYILF